MFWISFALHTHYLSIYICVYIDMSVDVYIYVQSNHFNGFGSFPPCALVHFIGLRLVGAFSLAS